MRPSARSCTVLLAAVLLSSSDKAGAFSGVVLRAASMPLPVVRHGAGASLLGHGAMARALTHPRRAQLLRCGMAADDAPEPEPAAGMTGDDDEFAGLDASQKQFKAAAMRKEAIGLDETAAALRKQAVETEQKAALLRIQAWKLEGGVSAVTKQITVQDKYQKQLAELDLMAEDWVDTDEEKWEWYQQQRKMIIDMIGAQKEYDEKADESLQDLREVLIELQETLDIETVLPNGDITSAGWGFVLLSVVIPAWIGYELFAWVTTAGDAATSLLSQGNDPFKGL